MTSLNGAGAGSAATDLSARKVVPAGELGEQASIADPLQNQENAPNGVYVASDIKRFRRTKAAITDIRKAIFDILSTDNPQTVRQVFYALTVRGVIKKEEVEYQRTVVRLLT